MTCATTLLATGRPTAAGCRLQQDASLHGPTIRQSRPAPTKPGRRAGVRLSLGLLLASAAPLAAQTTDDATRPYRIDVWQSQQELAEQVRVEHADPEGRWAEIRGWLIDPQRGRLLHSAVSTLEDGQLSVSVALRDLDTDWSFEMDAVIRGLGADGRALALVSDIGLDAMATRMEARIRGRRLDREIRVQVTHLSGPDVRFWPQGFLVDDADFRAYDVPDRTLRTLAFARDVACADAALHPLLCIEVLPALLQANGWSGTTAAGDDAAWTHTSERRRDADAGDVQRLLGEFPRRMQRTEYPLQ